jgi:hypothetical protein
MFPKLIGAVVGLVVAGMATTASPVMALTVQRALSTTPKLRNLWFWLPVHMGNVG